MQASEATIIAENTAAVNKLTLETFNPSLYLINVQGNRKYLPVPARLIWFHLARPEWSIETELVKLDTDKEFAIFKAIIRDENGKVKATGHKREDKKDFGDYLEKAETGACGRALGILGYGTEHEPAFEELHRYTDAPAGGYGQRSGGRQNYSRDRAPQAPQQLRPAPTAPRPALTVAEAAPVAAVGFQPQAEARPAHPIDADPRWAEVNPFDKSEWEAYQQAKANYDAAMPAGAAESTPATEATDGPLICQGVSCGDTVTRAQNVASKHKYQLTLCPSCQKDRAREMAAAPQPERMAA